jgi:ferrochelatase
MSMPGQRIGVLLVNLGTPDSTKVADVRRYLDEFLNDPRVIDINPVGRWLLLKLFILPFRPKKSAHAYQQIWTPEGSPLLTHSQALASQVARQLGDRFVVELAMRYGAPAIARGMERLTAADVERIIVFPLYPQHAAASTGSSIEKVYEVASRAWTVPAIETVPEFYDHPGFIDAFAKVARPVIDGMPADHVLFSYHGLPERHMVKGDPTGTHCLRSESCCDAVGPANRHCYRAQCYATSRALVDALGLAPGQSSSSFQSRLGSTPWIHPYTDLVLPELAKAGKKRIAVMCPAFVADCLETLEEIGMRAKEQWRSLGGEALELVPSLNSTPAWVDTVCAIVRSRTRTHALEAGTDTDRARGSGEPDQRAPLAAAVRPAR